jgi:serine/threonine protein phosphatase 1
MARPAKPTAGPGRLIAIGDVHGYALALEQLLRLIDPEPSDRLVFLGDYIDRGPDSRGVIAMLIELATEHPRTIFLRGNHEQALLDWLFGDDDQFLYHGGRQTIASYLRAAGRRPIDQPLSPRSFEALLPPAHLAFITRTQLYFETSDCLFVHAGLDPARGPVLRQACSSLLVGHRDFFHHARYAKKVVVGHSSTEIFRRHHPVFLPNGVIMCDTSYARTGVLSAACPRSGETHQVRHPAPEPADLSEE